MHRIFASNDSLMESTVNYRIKLPDNPMYIRRTIYNNRKGGEKYHDVTEVFTV